MASKVHISLMRKSEGDVGLWIYGPHGRFLLWLEDTGLPFEEMSRAVLTGMYKAYIDPVQFKADAGQDPGRRLEAEKLIDAAKEVGPAIVEAAKDAGII